MSKYQVIVNKVDTFEGSNVGGEATQEVYRQTVDTIDLTAVIKAVNNLQRKRRAATKEKKEKA